MDFNVENANLSPPRRSIPQRLKTHLREELDGNDWKFILIALTIALTTGMEMIQFTSDFPINVFSQPAQILYLTGPEPTSTPLILITAAFGSFFVCVILTGQVAVQMHWKQKRWWLIATMIAQVIGTLAVAVLRMVRPHYLGDRLMLPEVILVAAVGGIQVATMRCLDGRVNKVNTIQFNGALVNMVIDPNLWKLRNPNRNVRGLFILSVIAGAWIGMWTLRTGWRCGGSGLTFLVIALIKTTWVLGGLFLIPGRKPGAGSSGPQGSPVLEGGILFAFSQGILADETAGNHTQAHKSYPAQPPQCPRCLHAVLINTRPGSQMSSPLLEGESYEMLPLPTPADTHSTAVSHLDEELSDRGGTWPRSRFQHVEGRFGKMREEK